MPPQAVFEQIPIDRLACERPLPRCNDHLAVGRHIMHLKIQTKMVQAIAFAYPLMLVWSLAARVSGRKGWNVSYGRLDRTSSVRREDRVDRKNSYPL